MCKGNKGAGDKDVIKKGQRNVSAIEIQGFNFFFEKRSIQYKTQTEFYFILFIYFLLH